MAVDAFLKIEGIKGESIDSKHKGEIVIESGPTTDAAASPLPPDTVTQEGEPTSGESAHA